MPVDQKFDDYAHWQAGGSLQGFSAQRLTALAGEVTRLNMSAYSDPKHQQHTLVSQEVAELHRLAVAATAAGETPV